MPKADWDNYDEEDIQSFDPVPDDDYLVKLVKIDEKWTKDGKHEMWNLQLRIMKGDYQKRMLFDSLVFNLSDPKGMDAVEIKKQQTAMKRVKMICKRLGFMPTGEHDLVTEDILNRSAIVTTENKYAPDAKGNDVLRSKIKFDGWTAITDETDAAIVIGDVEPDPPNPISEQEVPAALQQTTAPGEEMPF